MNQKKQTKRSTLPKVVEPKLHKEIDIVIEDALSLNEGQAMAIEKDMYNYAIQNKATHTELLQYICRKLNTEKEWRAWAAVLMFKKVVR